MNIKYVSICAIIAVLLSACTAQPRADQFASKRFQQLSEREYLSDSWTSFIAIKDTATGKCYIVARAPEAIAILPSNCVE